MTHLNVISSTEAIYLSLFHAPSYQKFLEDGDVLFWALTQSGLNKIQALGENLFLFCQHFSFRAIEKLMQLEEPIFADIHLAGEYDHIRLLPFSDAIVRDLTPMVGDLIQNNNTIPFTVFLHDQPRVSRSGYQFPIHHWARHQPNDFLNVLSIEQTLLHGPIVSDADLQEATRKLAGTISGTRHQTTVDGLG